MYMYSDIKPIRVSTENEKSYTPNLAIAHTQRVTKEHEEAFAAFVKGLDNIFKHGLPNESSVGKLMETLFKNVAEIREQNEGLFKNHPSFLIINYFNIMTQSLLFQYYLYFFLKKQKENILFQK